MNDFLHRVFGNNQVKDYVWVVAIFMFIEFFTATIAMVAVLLQ